MKSQKKENGLLGWIHPELVAHRNLLLTGWGLWLVLALAFGFGGLQDGTRTDSVLLAIIAGLALLYGVMTVTLIRMYHSANHHWNRLTSSQQAQLQAKLDEQPEESILYRHVMSFPEFLGVYSRQKPAILYYEEIAWMHTLQGKIPRSATSYFPQESQKTNVDNYLVFYSTCGKKYVCFYGNQALSLYQTLVEKTPNAIHGMSEEKRQQYKTRR